MARLRPRTKQFLIAGAIGATIVLILMLTVIYLGYSHMSREQRELKARHQQEIDEAREVIREYEASHSTVWLLGKDIEAGHVIEEADFVSAELRSELLPVNLVAKEQAIGKVAKIPLSQQTMLVDSMLFENGKIAADIRLHEYSLVRLPLMLGAGDFVDIRVSFPGGQDYIVMSKKKVEHLESGTIWHELNEDELMTMSSAIVDAYVNDAYLYAIAYVDPYMQQKAVVNYPINRIVDELMDRDPNIVKRATGELERRERVRLEKQLEEMDPLQREKWRSGMGAGGAEGSIRSESGVQEPDQNGEVSPEQGTHQTAQTGGDSASSGNESTYVSPDKGQTANNPDSAQGATGPSVSQPPPITDEQEIFGVQPDSQQE